MTEKTRREDDAVAIHEGSRIPDVKVMISGEDGMPKPAQSGDLLGKGKVVLFAVPGAFTPGCSNFHLPGFVLRAPELLERGVDRIACVAVNDAFVMKAWGDNQEIGDAILMIGDGNGDFTKSMGLEMDGSGFGLGQRSQRYAAILEDGVVKKLLVEPAPGVDVSSADNVLANL
jgi:glutaredoxin/glutathione-dependent peroxiredoxin